MPIASKIEFVPFTPYDTDLQRTVYRSDRNTLRGGLRDAFDAAVGTDMTMPYTAEEYARVIVWSLGWILDGWPFYIPFTNLSSIEGGARPLRILMGLWQNGTLKFVRAPQSVRERALHDPESVLPDAMAAAALGLRPRTRTRTVSPPKLTLPRCQGLLPHSAHSIPGTTTTPVPAPAHSRIPAEEVADNLEPILSTPLDPDSPRRPHERRQRSDIKKARHRPTGKKSRSRKVGPLTSRYVLDTPGDPSAQPARGRVLEPLSGDRLPLMVDEFIGDYTGVA